MGESAFQDYDIPEESDFMPFTSMPTPNDYVIAVMGVTGVGKSTFISHFNPAATAGDSLESCTAQVGIYEAAIGDRKVFLVDTPGFDDTRRSNRDILREVADWLNRSHQAQIKLAGIIYLHRIGDPRMGGAALTNLHMFRKLCGEDGLSCVVLATTMWSNPPTSKELRREDELTDSEQFWAGMIRKGSTVFRHDTGHVSGSKIIQYILDRRQKVTLKIQEEMADGKTLDQTAAGQQLEVEIAKLKADHERELLKLREEMHEARMENDIRAQQEIQSIREEIEARMREEEAKNNALRVTMEELQKQRDEEMREQREREYQKEMAHKEAMWRHESEISSLRAKNEYETKLIQANYQNQIKDAELQRLRNQQKSDDSSCILM